MYECHAHIMLDGVNSREALRRHADCPDETLIRAALEKYRAAGVRYIRDGGDKLGVSVLAARIAPEYGIELRSPCFAIHRRGRYGDMLGRAFSDMGEYRQLVEEVKRQGGDYIKIMATGILDFNEPGRITSEPLDAAELGEMLRIAHGEGFAVMLHCNGADSIKAAVATGVDSIEHGFYADSAALADMAGAGTIWVPTFAPIVNLIGSGLFPDENLESIARRHAGSLAEALELGVTIAPGSDAGALGVLQAEGIAAEYGLLRQAAPELEPDAGGELVRRRFCRK